MSRIVNLFIVVIGFLCLIYGSVLLQSQQAYAQDDDREYVGVGECNDCHGGLSRNHNLTPHGMTLQEVEADAPPEDLTFVMADFTLDESLRTITLPDGTERAFDLSDVAFTLGAGRHYQAYVMQIEEDRYRVLPAKWDVEEGAWTDLALADTWDDRAYDFGASCAGCHTVGLEYNAEDDLYTWEDESVQCEACHGPGSQHIDLVDDAGRDISGAEYLEFSGALADPTDAQVCGACHSRGLAEDGIHPYAIDYTPGGTLSEHFTQYPPDDETHWFAEGYAKQGNMQYSEWVLSGHASSLDLIIDNSVAETACLMCHSGTSRFASRALGYPIDAESIEFETAPLILHAIENSGIPPSKQQLMIQQWLPLVLEPAEADPEAVFEDILFEIFDLLRFDEDDYDPDAPLLVQFMPQLADFVQRAQEDALDGDTRDLDDITALMQQLMPFIIDDIMAQKLPVAEVLDSNVVENPMNFGVTCATCHKVHLPEVDEDAPPIEQPSSYDVCTACHQNTSVTATMHHPVKEMFEGEQIIADVGGIASTHFSQSEGPRCATCHMSDIPVADGSMRSNHTWNPVIPSSADGSPPSACEGCHTDLTAEDLASLILDTQDVVDARLSLAWGRVASIEVPEPDSEHYQLYNDAIAALTFIQNDGSKGIHNYAYTDVLLNTAADLISQLNVPGAVLQATEAPAPTATPNPDEAFTPQAELSVTSGARPITFLIPIGAILLIFLGGAVLFRRPRKPETTEEVQS